MTRKLTKTAPLLCVMRCTIFLILFTLPFKGLAQDNKPQLFPKLYGVNKSASFGLMGVGIDGFDYGAIGINATVYGAYVDFMGWPRKNAKNVKSTDWEELAVWAAHVGYQLPVHQYLDGCISIAPMLGYYAKKEAAIISADKPTSVTTGHFDYGGALVFQRKDDNIGIYKFQIAYTRYTISVSLGLVFPL